MNRDRLDFGNERIGSLFRALFFPTLIGMVFNSLLNICDGMFVGHGVGSDALAAIYQSMEKAARSTAYTMLRGIVFLVPSFLVLPPLLGEKGLWLAIPAAEVLTLAVIAVLFLYRRVRV